MHENTSLTTLCKEILGVFPSLHFTILEIGAVPLTADVNEPFHKLLKELPGTTIHAFEVGEEVCARLNAGAPEGMKFHARAIGRKHEKRPFYITNHPMCSSLYAPNHALISQFNNMEVAYLKQTTSIETITIDEFVRSEGIRNIDFIKIDIQGAELDAFRGAVQTLADVSAIVTEVEFLPHYENQPLFGDVCTYLAKNGLMFHKFLGLQGRALRPIVLSNNPRFPSWHIWSDAMFVSNLSDWTTMDSARLLKLAILGYIYGSPDISFRCLQIFDSREQTQLHRLLLRGNIHPGGPG